MCQLCEIAAPTQTSRRRFLAAAACTAASLALAPPVSAKETKSPPKPQNVLAPDAALDRLVKGNLRYVEGVSRRHGQTP